MTAKPLDELKEGIRARLRPYPAWVTKNHKLIILISTALAIAGAVLASTLPLRTDFAWLLPDKQPSVIALRELTARKTSSAVIEIGVASPTPEVTRRFAADLAAALRQKLPPDLLSEVDEDDGDVRSFVWDHRHLYAPKKDLEAALDALRQRVTRAAGFDLGLDDDDKKPGDDADQKRLDELRGELSKLKATYQRAPGYLGEEGKLRMLVLRCRFADTDPERGARTVAAVKDIVAGLAPTTVDPGLEVGFAGDPVSAAQEHDLVLSDVVTSTALCLFLVAVVMMAFFRAFRGVIALCITLGVGCCVTFGFTRLWIGHLNTSTAFLGSVVAGNGINFGIIFLARYFEERRRRGATNEAAIATALGRTAIPTLVACAAAGSAYLSLTITTFRGFSEFGIIAGSGMVFCWIASFVVLPAWLTLLETRRALVRVPAAIAPPSSRRSWPGGAFTYALAGAVVLGTTAVSVLGAHQLYGSPFEDDLRVLRSRSYPTSATGRWSKRLDAAFGRDQSGGFYIGVEKAADVELAVKALRAAEQDTPPAERQFGKIDALSEVMPGDAAEQAEKIRVLDELRRVTDKLAPHLAQGSDDARLLAELRPPPGLRPVGFDDLPERVKRAFTENDGRRGLLLAVHPAPASDGVTFHGLLRSVAALRSVKLPAGAEVSGSDVIFVEMMEAVQREGPRASILSFVLVLLLLFFSFGPSRGFLATTYTLSVGVFGMFGLMWFTGVRLNFLNYIAVPITIGIGVDYPFNIVTRIRQEGGTPSRGVLRTAGAVALASSTTVIGYAVLLLSDTGAIRSFGAAAVLGELTSISAALIVVPALVLFISMLTRGPRPDPRAAGGGAA